MGGTVPIGYGMEARRLVPVEESPLILPHNRRAVDIPQNADDCVVVLPVQSEPVSGGNP